MKIIKILSVIVVFAAAGMPGGCVAGLMGMDVAALNANASGETQTPVTYNYASQAPDYAGPEKVPGPGKVTVKFVVCNGGWGLVWSKGIVSTAGDDYLVRGGGSWANDFHITIPVPERDNYVNIRWHCMDSLYRKFWVKGTMRVNKAGDYAVVFDFNADTDTNGWDVDTQNLEEIYKYGPDSSGNQNRLPADWDNALDRSVNNEAPVTEYTPVPAGTPKGRTDAYAGYGDPLPAGDYYPSGGKITVRFDVTDGGSGLNWSQGIVSTANDNYFVYNNALTDDNFNITIPVPERDNYVNIRWHCMDTLYRKFWVKGTMRVKQGNQYTVGLIFNDDAGQGRWDFDTRNLGEVCKYGPDSSGALTWMPADWDYAVKMSAARKKSGDDPDAAPVTDTVNLKFEVLNGGAGLMWSKAMISTQDDSHVIWDGDTLANDFYMSITVPDTDEYINVRWLGGAFFNHETVFKAKLDYRTANKILTINYNGYKKVTVKNLYDVRVGGGPGALMDDWDAAREIAIKDIYSGDGAAY